ncbi:MAG: hypothetical protein LW630_02170 [Saprospiraceae bacterium]|nr:hypothetical protein [Saprospiraceae bacterium]
MHVETFPYQIRAGRTLDNQILPHPGRKAQGLRSIQHRVLTREQQLTMTVVFRFDKSGILILANIQNYFLIQKSVL